MGSKIKQTQKEDLQNVSGRDLFQTPDYATDLLIPFLEELLPMSPTKLFRIWECASGKGKIVNRLNLRGFDVFGTDLSHTASVNFFTDTSPIEFDCIVTNPPYSLKKKFYLKCLEYQKPFALLIPWDMSGWVYSAYKDDGCQAIIPSRRINFITPTGKSEATGHTANYHSFWLTRGFNLDDQLNFIELTKEMKENI